MAATTPIVQSVLIADNDTDFLDARAEYLEKAGYAVFRAFTLDDARRLLSTTPVHLAILDIRLVDDDDEHDKSGLALARDPAFWPIPKIILTGHPNFADVRAAMAPGQDGRGPALNFLAKEEGLEPMLDMVAQVFQEKLSINWQLEIQRDPKQLSFLHLAEMADPAAAGEELPGRAGELLNILCRVFHGYERIRIERPLWYHGRRFCLAVLARSSRGVVDGRLVVCGPREAIRQERTLVEDLAPNGVQVLDCVETVHFGGVAYDLPESDVASIRSLRAAAAGGSDHHLRVAFDCLLDQVLPAWHTRGASSVDDDLMALYRRQVGLGDRSLVEQRVEALVQTVRGLGPVDVERDGEGLTFVVPMVGTVICPDPVTTIYEDGLSDGPVICRVSPGGLAADRILVSAQGQVSLNDFAAAGQAPQWWDFVCLEAAVRFDLGQAPTLEVWEQFETCLVAPDTLARCPREGEVIPELQFHVRLAGRIREKACQETGEGAWPYYAGLLVWTVGAMFRYDPDAIHTLAEQRRAGHLLLAAGLLARRLAEMPRLHAVTHHDGDHKLRLDKDDVRVWISPDKAVVLAGQPLKLFRRLYDRAGQVVPRGELASAVFDEPYQPDNQKDLDHRLTNVVRLLREEIEPYPGKPRYILTVRRQGYRLVKGGLDPGGG